MAEGGPAEGCAGVPAAGAEYAEGCCYEETKDRGGTTRPAVARNTQETGTPSPHSAPSATLCASVPAAGPVLVAPARRPLRALCRPLREGLRGAGGTARRAGVRRYGANTSTAPRARLRRDHETLAPGRSQRAPGRRTI